MSIEITLQAIPNQELTIQLDDVRYALLLQEAGGIMAASLSIDEVVVLQGIRVVAGGPLFPYKYMEGDGGNFIFVTESEEIPFYTEFGITQSLIYLTVAEIEAL